MNIHQTIKEGIKEALRAKDDVRLRTFRSLVTAMTNEVMAKKRKPDEFLTDEEALAVLKRASNQRKDSIEQFVNGGRPELAEPEQAERAVIATLLPLQLSREDIEKVVRTKMSEHGITEKSKAGQLTGVVMKELKGGADGGDVKAVIETLLS